MPANFDRMIVIAALAALPFVAAADPDARLIEAARNGDRGAINVLLDSGADAATATADGTTPLHHAAHRDDVAVARSLLAAGATADAANVYGVTPLTLACVNRSAGMVDVLLAAGAAPDAAMWTGETPLMTCARTGAMPAVRALLEAGADPNARETTKGQTALMWAAAGGHADIAELLVGHGAEIGAATSASADRVPNSCRICAWKPSPGGFTALMFAARSGSTETVARLLEAGADLDGATAEYGSPLVIAAASGHEQLSLYLLAAGADPDSADENGVTALHFALRRGLSTMHGITYDAVYRVRPDNMPGLADALLEAGADPNARIGRSYRIGPAIRSSCESADEMVGATPFLLAAVSADVNLLELLARRGADPAIGTEDGTTPLMHAARSACTARDQQDNAVHGRRERALAAVKAIVAMGVDVNDVNDKGDSAMHKAAFSGADAVVGFLAAAGARVDERNASGETPWSMAAGISPSPQGRGEYGLHETTAALLLELGASPISRADMNVPDAYSNFLGRQTSIDHEGGTVGANE
jgi:ankyrin repeat protein